MGIINKLDLHVANLIAAGEVVDRPASCIKELVENALDAGASEITVEIKRGGIQFMRVTDNGCGMSRDDLPVSVMRHATSKIKTEYDLDGIMTLGFRGEALAAIASVSNLRIMTKRREDPVGSLLVSECGTVIDVTETGAPNGTTVIVENLFENVPARRKFLKRDVSEGMAVAAIIEKLALSRPDVAIKFISDNTVKFATAGDSKLYSAIYGILGRDFSKSLIKVNSLTQGIEVVGYIGKPNAMRSNRNQQIYFINGRYFKSKTVTAALEQGFDSFSEAGKFPTCVLFVSVHPTFVDVNVHPTKLEVKFSNEKWVFDAVYCAVKNALLASSDMYEVSDMKPSDRSYYNAFAPVEDKIQGVPEKSLDRRNAPDVVDSLISQTEDTPVMPISDEAPDTQTDMAKTEGTVSQTTDNTPPSDMKAHGVGIRIEFSEDEHFEEKSDDKSPEDKGESKNPPSAREDTDAGEFFFGKTHAMSGEVNPQGENTSLPRYRIIGTAFDAYIFVEVGEKTLVIDKHAAHERIIFENMRLMMKKQNKSTQMLIIPIAIKATPEEYAAVKEYSDDIKSCGFEFETDDESYTVAVTQIPSFMSSAAASEMLVTIMGRLSDGTGSVESARDEFFEKSLYQASCKSAMKAGIKDDDVHIKWLVESLLRLPDIKYCPHGRPVAFEMSKRDIEKFFKRT